MKAPLSATIFDYFSIFFPILPICLVLCLLLSLLYFYLQAGRQLRGYSHVVERYQFQAIVCALYGFGSHYRCIESLFELLCNTTGQCDSYRVYEYVCQNKRVDYASNIQLQVEPGVIAYISRYDNSNKTGYRFSLEKFDKKVLQSRLTAQTIHYDSAYHWRVNNYVIRNFNGMREELIKGSTLDTIVPIEPSDFLISQNDSEVMTTPELRRYIIRQKERGVANIKILR